MKLKLVTPRSSLYWTLVAEDLQDPSNWSVFLLNHGSETDRFQFEQAAERNLVLTPYRLMCKRGICTLEYGGEADPRAVKAHAQSVSDLLSTPLDVCEIPVAPRILHPQGHRQ